MRGITPEVIKAARRCPTCQGSGVEPQSHGGAYVEYLGCYDCKGTGDFLNELLNDAAVHAIIEQALIQIEADAE